ncbi:MAG: IS3 family transposase, partial [Oscillospiraceae bacterium]
IQKEYGISHSALANWIKQYSEVKIDSEPVMTANQIKALQKRNAQLEEENLILKKANCDIHAALGQRLRAVELLSNEHKISTLCRVLKVNRSTYYKYLRHKPSKREVENRHIRTCIVELYAKTDKRLGCGKIALCLKRDYRISISRGRVYRLMKAMNLPKMSTVKPFKPCGSHKDENGDCNNILSQQFNQPAPNTAWVCDFTYIRVGSRYFYFCAIMDLYARKIIAYKVSSRIDTKLAIDTLDAAVAARGKSKGVIFHTDRGCQFTSKCFRKHLDVLEMVQSFSAKGHPYDNAVMECFFKYLKKEETDRRTYSSPDELKISLFKYINGFYNSVRPHSSNLGFSPDMQENLFFLS